MGYCGVITFFHTNNIEKCHKFYCDDLGLKFHYEKHGYRLYDVWGKGMIGFGEVANDTVECNCISLVVESKEEVNNIYTRMRILGYEIYEEPKELSQFGVYSFFLQDPDEHRVEIMKFI